MEFHTTVLLLFSGCFITAYEVSAGRSFFCQYYSDGSTVCYNKYRESTLKDVGKYPADRLDPAFAIVLLGNPVLGSWTTEDGIFTYGLNREAAKQYIGSCIFDGRRGFECSTPPTLTFDEATNSTFGLGGAMFRGMGYSGKPGSPIRFAPHSVGPPSS